jgi:hypothetical protein
MHDVQQKLSNFHGILDIAFYYLVKLILSPLFFFYFNFILFPHNGKTVFMNTERYACLKITQKMYECYLKNQSCCHSSETKEDRNKLERP